MQPVNEHMEKQLRNFLHEWMKDLQLATKIHTIPTVENDVEQIPHHIPVSLNE